MKTPRPGTNCSEVYEAETHTSGCRRPDGQGIDVVIAKQQYKDWKVPRPRRTRPDWQFRNSTSSSTCLGRGSPQQGSARACTTDNE